MKNVLKFGFLGLAFSVAIAACNQTTDSSGADETGDSLTNEIENNVGAAQDSLDAMADSLVDSVDSLAEDM